MQHILASGTLAVAMVLASAPASAVQEAEAADQEARERAEQPEEAKQPGKLEIGDEAPELAIGRWVKGEPVERLETGNVYVVEFWASWCGPCIAGMPHISKLQEKYGDEVKVIGVNIWEDPAAVDPFMKGEGDKKPGNELMGYRVAVEEKFEGSEDVRNGKMVQHWMRPAGQNGIPAAFIIDRERRVAWIGHPMSMDLPLKEVVEGRWDIEKFKEINARAESLQAEAMSQARASEFAQAAATLGEMVELWPEMYGPQVGMQRFQFLMQAGEIEEATSLARRAVDEYYHENPMMLGAMAWMIATSPQEPRDLKLALRAAERAEELSDEAEMSTLLALARVHFEMGNLDKAIEIQERAVEAAQGPMRRQAEQILEQYKAERDDG